MTSEVEVKPKRGRETAMDMVRSLSIVLLVVLALWWLARPPASDVAEIRVVETRQDLSAFSEDAPGAPVPQGLSSDWRATSSTLDAQPRRIRIGYVTPSTEYAEYAATTGPGQEFVEQITAQSPRTGEVDVDGVTWTEHTDADGSLSLVRSFGSVTVVLGSSRASASLDELRELARSLRPQG